MRQQPKRRPNGSTSRAPTVSLPKIPPLATRRSKLAPEQVTANEDGTYSDEGMATLKRAFAHILSSTKASDGKPEVSIIELAQILHLPEDYCVWMGPRQLNERSITADGAAFLPIDASNHHTTARRRGALTEHVEFFNSAPLLFKTLCLSVGKCDTRTSYAAFLTQYFTGAHARDLDKALEQYKVSIDDIMLSQKHVSAQHLHEMKQLFRMAAKYRGEKKRLWDEDTPPTCAEISLTDWLEYNFSSLWNDGDKQQVKDSLRYQLGIPEALPDEAVMLDPDMVVQMVVSSSVGGWDSPGRGMKRCAWKCD